MFKLPLGKSVLSHQIWIFAITFMLYAAVHAARKTIGSVANPLESFGYTSSFISYMNSAFMMSYAIGMVFTGTLGDKFKPTVVLLISCLLSAAICTVFGLMSPTLTGTSMWYLYIIFWVINGVAQSCVWPAEVKLMSNWFGGDHSGSIFGIWCANACVGNILGIGLTAICFSIWDKDQTGVSWAFIIPSAVLVFAVALTFLLPNTRTEGGFEEVPTAEDQQVPEITSTKEQPKMSFWAAWLLPGIIRYSLCYACIKSVNYTLFFWLTKFLEDIGHPSSISYLITALNDVGWIFGGLACGYGSDKMGSRAPYVGLFILISIIPTALVYPCADNAVVVATLITLNGFFVGGAGNVVASAVCADLGKNEKVKGSADVTSQVVGIVDGVGALGAAICQLAVGYLSRKWALIFYGLTVMLGVSLALISDLVYRETLEWWANRKLSAVKSETTSEIVVDEKVSDL